MKAMTIKAFPLLCLMAAGTFAYGFQSAAQAPAKGSIEGQVVNAKTGSPLKRATVRVMGMNTMGGVVGSIAPNVASAITTAVSVAVGPGQPATIAPAPPSAPVIPNRGPMMLSKETDDQGHFVITGLDPGKYRVTVERQGFLRQSYGAKKFSGGSMPIVVAEGQTVKGIDVKLMPQGVIAGKVLDEDGEPVANVQVRAQRAFTRNGKKQWNVAANANTSDIGEYRLPELQPGRYVVVTTPRMNGMNMVNTPNTEPLPATPETTYAATYYPSTADSATAIPVDVGEGTEVRNIDVRLVKAQVFRIRGKVTGMVQNGNNTRAVVPVMLTPRDGPVLGQIPMAQARAVDGGVFEIRNVPTGQYLAHAQTNVNGVQYVAVAPVDVVGSHVEGVVLAMSTGGDVQGTVKVVDAANPVDLKNLQVNLRTVGFGGQAPRAKVGEDMKFTLKSVPPVNYAVSVGGYPDTCYVKSILYGGAEVTDDGVLMSNGGTIEVTISAGAGQMDFVVMTKDDKAANGAQVLVMRDDVPWQSRNTDENGMLSMKGLKPGSYKVLAWEDIDSQRLFDTDYLRKFESDFKSVKIDSNSHEAVQLKAISPESN